MSLIQHPPNIGWHPRPYTVHSYATRFGEGLKATH